MNSRQSTIRSCKRAIPQRQHGAALVLLVFLLPVILAIAAFSINVVYMELTRTELQISTDIATRAAGKTLAVTGDQKRAIAAAQRFAASNPVGNQAVNVKTSDVSFGVSTRVAESQRYSFAPGKNPNAVRIDLSQLDAKTGGGLPMLFPTMGVPVNFRPIKSAISTQSELDIAIVLDRSGSMAFADNEIAGNYKPAAAPWGWKFGNAAPPKSRWLDTVNAIQQFLTLISSSNQVERLSLITYSDNIRTDVKLTTDYTLVNTKLNAITSQFDGGATNIGGGILEGTKALGDKSLPRPWASRVIIVMTDGIHNTGTDPIWAAQQAANANVTLFTVSFSAEANQSQMAEIARIGAGKHFHSATGAELADAFKEIAHNLPTLVTF